MHSWNLIQSNGQISVLWSFSMMKKHSRCWPHAIMKLGWIIHPLIVLWFSASGQVTYAPQREADFSLVLLPNIVCLPWGSISLLGTKANFQNKKACLWVYKVMINAQGFCTNDFLLLPRACSRCASDIHLFQTFFLRCVYLRIMPRFSCSWSLSALIAFCAIIGSDKVLQESQN